MPTPIICVDYDPLQHAAQLFEREAQSCLQTLKQIEQAQNALESGGWKSQGATQFYNEMHSSVLPALKRLVKALETAGRVTRQVAQIMAQAEQEAAALFKGDGQGATATAGGSTGAAIGNTTIRQDGAVNANLSQDIIDRWNTLSDAEKRQVMQNIANDIARQHGMGTIPVSVEQLVDPEGLNSLGYWDGSRIHVDVDDLSDPNAAINTVVHEARHAVQEHMVHQANPNWWDSFLRFIGLQPTPQWPQYGITEATAQNWANNFANYISPPAAYDPADPASVTQMNNYLNQPVESDARDYAEQFVDNLTLDQFNGYVPTPTPTPERPPTPPPPVTPTPTPGPRR